MNFVTYNAKAMMLRGLSLAAPQGFEPRYADPELTALRLVARNRFPQVLLSQHLEADADPACGVACSLQTNLEWFAQSISGREVDERFRGRIRQEKTHVESRSDRFRDLALSRCRLFKFEPDTQRWPRPGAASYLSAAVPPRVIAQGAAL